MIYFVAIEDPEKLENRARRGRRTGPLVASSWTTQPDFSCALSGIIGPESPVLLLTQPGLLPVLGCRKSRTFLLTSRARLRGLGASLTLDWLFLSRWASSTTRQAQRMEPRAAWSMVISSYEVSRTWNLTWASLCQHSHGLCGCHPMPGHPDLWPRAFPGHPVLPAPAGGASHPVLPRGLHTGMTGHSPQPLPHVRHGQKCTSPGQEGRGGAEGGGRRKLRGLNASGGQ